mgnify:CR=1 FL=1
MPSQNPRQGVHLPSFISDKSITSFANELNSKDFNKSKALRLIDKHKFTVQLLREKLGFKEDVTVLAWLLEQVEQSNDLGKTIYQLLKD